MPLDRKRPFATISPPERGAAFKQGNKFYNQNGLEVDWKTGDTVEQPPIERVATGGLPEAIDSLLSQSQSLTPHELRVKAAALIGKEPPSTKADILIWLNSIAVEALADAQNKLRSAEARAAAAEAKTGKLDDAGLAAWARGEHKVLFDEVRQAILERFHANVSTKNDAIDLLIREGVVERRLAMGVEPETESEEATAR